MGMSVQHCRMFHLMIMKFLEIPGVVVAGGVVVGGATHGQPGLQDHAGVQDQLQLQDPEHDEQLF